MAKKTSYTEDELRRLYKRFTEKKPTANWLHQWEDVALYSMPGKADFITERTDGDSSRQEFMFDSTAPVASYTLASHIHSALTSPALPWLDIVFRSPEDRDNKDSATWLEECVRRLLAAINESNFTSVINEVYQDLVGFGTAILETGYDIDSKTREFTLVFRAHPIAKFVIFEDKFGRVAELMYEEKLKGYNMAKEFPDHDNADLREAVAERPDEDFKVLHVVKRNPDYEPNSTVNRENRMYCELHIYKETLLKIDYHGEFPYQVPRWSKMTSEVYGYGPGLLALPDVRTINEAKRLEIKAYEKAIDPPMTEMANGVIGSIDVGAGGTTKVQSHDALKVLHSGTDWQGQQIKSEELRKGINAIYLMDQLVLPHRPNATATEVQVLYALMQRVLGPTAGRITVELLQPMILRAFGLMMRNGQLPARPETLKEAQVDILYTGPLVRAQDADKVAAIDQMIERVVALGQVDERALKFINILEALRVIAEQGGVPETVMRSIDEIEALESDEKTQRIKELEQMVMELQQQQQGGTQQPTAVAA